MTGFLRWAPAPLADLRARRVTSRFGLTGSLAQRVAELVFAGE